ncbi:hypothetical protein [Sporosarcina limicola]|uniref:Uncharacterized protein n=1 Tax=Sporosarcina limicola TaxID=34101 RepID=A0A927MHN9_9BACL|nr:hypothetical protein [Sporosarcina limicola]MBE1554053.1 hypothetical protein [Sporosarcina limicola]
MKLQNQLNQNETDIIQARMSELIEEIDSCMCELNLSLMEVDIRGTKQSIANVSIIQDELYHRIKELKTGQMFRMENTPDVLSSADIKGIILKEKIIEKKELENDVCLLFDEYMDARRNESKCTCKLAEDFSFIRELIAKVDTIDIVIKTLTHDIRIENTCDDE